MSMTQHVRLVGHANQQREFLQAYQSGRLHHAWLLFGPKGVGKFLFAELAAALLLGEQLPETRQELEAACQAKHLAVSTRHTFLKRMRAGGRIQNYFAFASGAEAENPGSSGLDGKPPGSNSGGGGGSAAASAASVTGGPVKAENIRAIQAFSHHTATRDSWRIVLVDGIENTTPGAFGALLKLLEEPPEKFLLFLISPNKGVLPKTIASRCYSLRFDVLKKLEVIEVLKNSTLKDKLSPENYKAAIRFSGGSLTLARILATEKTSRILEDVRLLAGASWDKTKQLACIRFYQSHPDRHTHLPLLLDLFQLMLGGVLSQDFVSPDGSEETERFRRDSGEPRREPPPPAASVESPSAGTTRAATAVPAEDQMLVFLDSLVYLQDRARFVTLAMRFLADMRFARENNLYLAPIFWRHFTDLEGSASS